MVGTQFIRYILVGLGLNASLYAAYLLLTWRALGSEAAMTVTFSLGVLLTFLAHRKITFRHQGDKFVALRRFLVCYAFLYSINFLALWYVSGKMRLPHQIVQATAIIVLALLAFTAQKFWIFPPDTVVTKRDAVENIDLAQQQ